MGNIKLLIFLLILNCQANHSRNGIKNASKVSIQKSENESENKAEKKEDETVEKPVIDKVEENKIITTEKCSEIMISELERYNEVLIKYMSLRSDEIEDSQQDKDLQVTLDELAVYCNRIIDLNKSNASSCKTSNKNISLENIKQRCEEYEQTII